MQKAYHITHLIRVLRIRLGVLNQMGAFTKLIVVVIAIEDSGFQVSTLILEKGGGHFDDLVELFVIGEIGLNRGEVFGSGYSPTGMVKVSRLP